MSINQKCLILYLLVYSCLFTFSGKGLCKISHVLNNPLSLNHDSIEIESLNKQVEYWLKGNNQNWPLIENRLDSIGEIYLNVYGKNSDMYAQLIHKRGVVEYKKGLLIHLSHFSKAIEFFQESIAISSYSLNHR